MSAVIIIVLAYLIGSIPFGLFIGKMRGIDVRHHGSGNIGATNVFRVLGRGWGILVFLCDGGKGCLAVLLGAYINAHFSVGFLHSELAEPTYLLPPVGAKILGGIWAIIGHTFPVWLGFKGGKGVATSLGVVMALVPAAALAALGVWIVLAFTTRYISVASIFASLTVPFVVGVFYHTSEKWPLFTLCTVAAFLILWRHWANIGRLLQGTEHRFGKPKKT